MTAARVGLILVGAGSSLRMGGVDKIWSVLAGRPVVWYSLTRLAPLVQSVCLVVREDQVPRATRELREIEPGLICVAGGQQRQDSVARGLAAMKDVEVVAVHDVARPLATGKLLEAGLKALDGHEGAVPVQLLHDTVKQIDQHGTVVRTVDRATLRSVQTPQLFLTVALRRAHETAAQFGHQLQHDQ